MHFQFYPLPCYSIVLSLHCYQFTYVMYLLVRMERKQKPHWTLHHCLEHQSQGMLCILDNANHKSWLNKTVLLPVTVGITKDS